jgi:CubicO group peptidase (beta-lactamase class C family)
MSARRRTHRSLLAVLACLLAACGELPAVDVPAADSQLEPTSGLPAPVRWGIDAALELSAMASAHSGYVALFAHRGRVVHAKTAGYADLEAKRPMALDTPFRIASMTKPVTAVAGLALIEERLLSLDDPVARYIPAAGGLRVATSTECDAEGVIPTSPLARPLTVRDLFTFTAGIGSGEEDSDLGRHWREHGLYAGTGNLAERIDRLMTLPLFEQPGQRWRYGGALDVLGRVMEIASGKPLDEILQSRIFDPLGMTSTRYLSVTERPEELAVVYTQDEDRNLIRVDRTALDAMDWTPGGGGLVSTAGDYMRFALMLWNRGSYDGARILSPETVALMTRPHVADGVLADYDMEGLGWGLGVAVVTDAGATPMIDRNGDFWWSGYLTTNFFVSPEKDLVGIVLAQNEPSPHTPLPYAVYLAPAFAFFGL